MVSHGEEGIPTAGEGANVTSAAEVSGNGGRVYFDSTAVLTTVSNRNGEEAIGGASNLYVYDTETDRTSFVARDAALVDSTRDGQFLIFESERPLDGTKDTSTVTQLFEYDAESGAVTRISAGQKGGGGYVCEATQIIEEEYNCDGNTSEFAPVAPRPTEDVRSQALPAASTTGLAVAEDGQAVFVSRDALTPGAVTGGENVYEYRAGDVYLISPGSESVPTGADPQERSRLLGISESGQSVFFASTEQLVPQDTDTQSSWYDAREGGGFPALTMPLTCVAEACRGALGVGPPLSVPLAPGVATEVPATLVSGRTPSIRKPSSQTKRARLKKALRVCKIKTGVKRRRCEVDARKRYRDARKKPHEASGEGN
jgi:hypothetical protein